MPEVNNLSKCFVMFAKETVCRANGVRELACSKILYTTYINVDLAHHEIFRAKVGKGGILINHYNMLL